MSQSPQFRYRCERFNTNYIKYPCAHNMDRIADLKLKNGDDWGNNGKTIYLGSLEHCVECRGNELITLDGGTLPEMTGNYDEKHDKAAEVVKREVMAGDKDAILRHSILGAIDIFKAQGVFPTRMMLSEHMGIKVYKIDLLIKELRTRGEIEIVPDSWPNEVRRPMIISSTTNEVAKINTASRCEKAAQNIPEIFQPAPAPNTRLVNIGRGDVAEIKPDSKDSLHTVDSSTCEILQTDSSGACKNERENRTENRTIQEDQDMAAVVKFKSEEEAKKYLGPGKVPEPEIPRCTRPDCEAPGSPVKIDKLGRSMGMCQACVNARGRRGGFGMIQSRKIPWSVEATIDQPKYVDLKKWLEAQGEENERTLIQEIIYRLKISMREASVT